MDEHGTVTNEDAIMEMVLLCAAGHEEVTDGIAIIVIFPPITNKWAECALRGRRTKVDYDITNNHPPSNCRSVNCGGVLVEWREMTGFELKSNEWTVGIQWRRTLLAPNHHHHRREISANGFLWINKWITTHQETNRQCYRGVVVNYLHEKLLWMAGGRKASVQSAWQMERPEPRR